jgi:hypothetical protein
VHRGRPVPDHAEAAAAQRRDLQRAQVRHQVQLALHAEQARPAEPASRGGPQPQEHDGLEQQDCSEMSRLAEGTRGGGERGLPARGAFCSLADSADARQMMLITGSGCGGGRRFVPTSSMQVVKIAGSRALSDADLCISPRNMGQGVLPVFCFLLA